MPAGCQHNLNHCLKETYSLRSVTPLSWCFFMIMSVCVANGGVVERAPVEVKRADRVFLLGLELTIAAV
jgi:hypothetical protein